MRATFLCVGTRGDVEPYLALARALGARGFQTTIACAPAFAAEVAARGLGYAPLGFDPQALLTSRRRDGGVIGQMRWLADGLRPALRGLFADSLKACRGADVIVGSLLAVSAGHLAEALGKPWAAAYLQPASRTREQPATSLGFGGSAWLNLLSHDLSAALVQQLMRGGVDAARREVLGLGPARRAAPLGERIVYGFSPHVVRRPSDWGAEVSVTGYWTEEPAGPLDGRLAEWLASEPASPALYLGFGSMPQRDLRGLVDHTLRVNGCRAVVGGADAAFCRAFAGDARVMPVGWVPHQALFPHLAAIVHHGGAGTTAAALRAGRPQVVVPHLGDQRFWGRRVAALGVGVGPLPRRALGGRALSAAVARCLGDRAMHERARALGDRLGRERGAARAAQVIAALAGERRQAAS